MQKVFHLSYAENLICSSHACCNSLWSLVVHDNMLFAGFAASGCTAAFSYTKNGCQKAVMNP